jgi:hypothetical protein
LQVPTVTTERSTLPTQTGAGGVEQKIPAHGSPTHVPCEHPLAQATSTASRWHTAALQARTRELTSVTPSLQKNGAATQSAAHAAVPSSKA